MPGRVSRKKDSNKVEYRDKAVKFTTNISQAVEEDAIEQGHFIDFLKNALKVGGKKGNLEYLAQNLPKIKQLSTQKFNLEKDTLNI